MMDGDAAEFELGKDCWNCCRPGVVKCPEPNDEPEGPPEAPGMDITNPVVEMLQRQQSLEYGATRCKRRREGLRICEDSNPQGQEELSIDEMN
jgi:hypothetical protein